MGIKSSRSYIFDFVFRQFSATACPKAALAISQDRGEGRGRRTSDFNRDGTDERTRSSLMASDKAGHCPRLRKQEKRGRTKGGRRDAALPPPPGQTFSASSQGFLSQALRWSCRSISRTHPAPTQSPHSHPEFHSTSASDDSSRFSYLFQKGRS